MEKIHNLTNAFQRGSVAGAVDSIKTKMHLPGKVATSILTGVIGSLLITLFLTTFLHSHETVTFLPWIIAFNTAVTGYALITKTGNQIKHKKISSLGAGTLNVLLTHVVLSFLFLYSEGEYLLGIWDLLFYLIIGIICSELGTLLAIKYLKTKK